MIRAVTLFAVIGLAMAALSLTGCDNGGGGGGGGDPNRTTYTGYDQDGNSYSLLVIKDPNRAGYDPQDGDNFILTIKDKNGKSIGTSKGLVIAIIPGGLKLENNGTEFTVSFNGTALQSITSETDKIPLDDNKDWPSQSSLTSKKPYTPPSNGGGGGQTSWPAELLGWWEVTSPSDRINFYIMSGYGDGDGSFFGAPTSIASGGFKLISITGKTIIVQAQPGPGENNPPKYTLCTDYTITGEGVDTAKLKLSGGDTIFSSIMNKDYTLKGKD